MYVLQVCAVLAEARGRALVSLELKLQIIFEPILCVLGTEPMSSTRAICVLKH